jgi:beta-N-acetylhexosaminidase
MILVCNDREGALEVLDFMTQQQVSGSDRIKMMLKSNSLSWAQLENHPRRVATMELLQNLNTNN